MKNVLFIVLGLFLLTAACKKKSPPLRNWYVSLNDSVYSNIQALRQKKTVTSFEIFNFSDGMMREYVKAKTHNDTILYTDTIEIDMHTASYEVY